MKITGSTVLQKLKEVVNRVIGQFRQRKAEEATVKERFSSRLRTTMTPSRVLERRRAEHTELSNWMGQIIPNHARINDVVIPGSHDSATSDLDHFRLPILLQPSAAVKLLISRFARTQGRNIGQQLKQGIRFLDLRITSQPKRGFVLHHGPAMGSRIASTMNQIDEFVANHPREAVFVKIELDSWMSPQQKDELCKILALKFSDKLYPCADAEMRKSPSDVTFGQMRVHKQNLMIILEDKGEGGDYRPPLEYKNLFWNWSTHVSSRWANTADNETLWKSNTEFLKTSKIQSRMIVSQLQMTAAFNPLKKPLEALRGAWQGLKNLAKESNSEATGWLIARRKENHPVNVVIMDFAGEQEGQELIKTTIAMNTTPSPYIQAMTDKDVNKSFKHIGPALNYLRHKM